ncbi:predicted protein [Naegleria gruberi]|uniref:Predicted protein n=1 Tax=Naegleria gruberi TaxID=5762 RepID=D2VRZ8_NAEGR|nr:uncharacterized protein NAEGRDRAFT_71760 [Naegleria gruberi]EFC40259.1 predicted protein [Naegleria gruberi]|eukprot:XP_002673003.1 predicted protein [Naegleria gruberi strain NEG-M]
MDIQLVLNNLKISDATNHSGTSKYKLVKLSHTDKDEMDEFCKKNISLIDKHKNHFNFYFKPSIEILDLKIEQKNRLFPYLPTINSTNNIATTKSVAKTTNNNNNNNNNNTKNNNNNINNNNNNENNLLILLTKAFSSLVVGLANNNVIPLDNNLMEIVNITNNINNVNNTNSVMIDDDLISTSSNESTQP